MPAFFEGGRITRDSIHYLLVNGVETPVHKTEFARDSVFAYSHSYLPDYVAEKTQGQIPADRVVQFLLAEVRSGSLERLLQLERNRCCVVDGEQQSDFDKFAADILVAASQGKRFLFRSGASILTSLANLGPQPIPATEMSKYVRDGKPGADYYRFPRPKNHRSISKISSTAPGIVGVEIDISQLVGDNATILGRALLGRDQSIGSIIFMQREIPPPSTPAVKNSPSTASKTRLQFGEAVSAFLMDVIRSLPHDIGFLISKGGITSNDTFSKGSSPICQPDRSARSSPAVRRSSLPTTSSAISQSPRPLIPWQRWRRGCPNNGLFALSG